MDIGKTARQQIAIVEGGNRFELHAQHFDMGRYPERTPFKLTLSSPFVVGSVAKVDIAVFVEGITPEDGSGNCWIINGRVDWRLDYPQWIRDSWEDIVFPRFEGFFNTKTRKGFLYPLN